MNTGPVIRPDTTRWAAWTSPSTCPISLTTTMQASVPAQRTSPLTLPSMRSPPWYETLPSTVVPLPIKVPMVFGAVTLLPNIASSHGKSLLRAHFPVRLNLHLHRTHDRAFGQLESSFDALIVAKR